MDGDRRRHDKRSVCPGADGPPPGIRNRLAGVAALSNNFTLPGRVGGCPPPFGFSNLLESLVLFELVTPMPVGRIYRLPGVPDYVIVIIHSYIRHGVCIVCMDNGLNAGGFGMKAACRHIAMAALVLGGSVAAHQARATILFDNLSTTVIGGDFINATSSEGGLNNGPLADLFSTGAAGFDLQEVELNLGAGNGNGTITVSLLSDSAGLPGTSISTIGTINELQLSGSSGVYAFSSFTPLTLAGSTRYWIELTDSNPDFGTGSAFWNYETDATGTDAGSADLSGELFYNSDFPDNPDAPSAELDTNGPYLMQLSDGGSAPAPEPATLALLGVGVAGLGYLRRRKR